MSGGQRIDDHSSWIGGKSKDSVFPEGVKTKNVPSAEGAGHEGEYEDTNESIVKQQEMGVSKAKGHPLKSGYRN
jgi:hypothetical protein